MPKAILITGTSSGLGLSLAVHAAKQGCEVVATMRDLRKREALDAAAQAAGVQVEVIELDVQNSDSVAAATTAALEKMGRIDVLVNNAGAGYVGTTEHTTEADAQWVMDVNFMGVVRCTKAVLPHMRRQGRGHVITLSSVGGLVGQPFNEFYCAAKFAVEGYIESLATYLHPGFGIDFTLVEPGGIASAFASTVMAKVEQSGGLADAAYMPLLQKYMATAKSRAQTPGVYQSSDEVARIVFDLVNQAKPPLRLRTSAWGEALCNLKTAADPDGTKLRQQIVRDFLGL